MPKKSLFSKTLVAAVLLGLVFHIEGAFADKLKPRLLQEQFGFSIRPPDARSGKFSVKTALTITKPCVAVATLDKKIDLLISRELLEELSKYRPTKPDLEDEGLLASIHAERAKRILQANTKSPGSGDCEITRSDRESQYLVGRLLASGQVVVFDVNSNKAISPITATITATPQVDGWVAYQVRDGSKDSRTFFALQLWIH